MDDFERFEQQVADMLRDRVADLSSRDEINPELLGRVRRRRTAKLTAIGATAVVVVLGATGAVAHVVDRSTSRRVDISKPSSTSTSSPSGGESTSTTTSTTTAPRRPGVAVLQCPVSYSQTDGAKLEPPPPLIRGRVPAAGDPAVLTHLASFAASADQRYVLLGPETWSCEALVATDGDNAMVVYPRTSAATVPDIFTAPIAIENGYLWHGGVGSGTACPVFDDPAVVEYVARNFSFQAPCPRLGRTVTRIDAHVSTFVDADGARGAGWIVLPSSQSADDGSISVLTCRPTAGLTVADCDTVIADLIARIAPDAEIEPPAVIPDAPFAARDVAPTAHGIVITDARSEHTAAYDATANSWRTLAAPPLGAQAQFVATRGDEVFAIGEPPGSSTTTPFAVLDVETGQWRALAPVPDLVFGQIQTTGDADRIFGFSATDGEVQRQIALEYDIAADRWTALPAAPLSARVGEVLQWTGREVLVWGGNDAHQGGIDSFPDGAAYEPATGKWRTLPAAPVPARWAAASVWTGTEVLVWGGSDCNSCGRGPVGAGAAYNPMTNQWRKIPTSPLRSRLFPPAVWTGSEMVVLGNLAAEVPAAAYDPATDTWRALPAPPASAPSVREGFDSMFAAWVGNHVVFGVSAQSGTGSDFGAFSYAIGG